jgi:hypothetical protein
VTASDLAETPTDDRVSITCDGHTTAGIFSSDHQELPLTFLAVLESNGTLVLTLVGENASRFLGITNGCDVTIKW